MKRRARLLAASSLAALLGASSPAEALDFQVTSETEPRPGVRVQALSVSNPKARAWVAYVDLCRRGVRIDASKASSQPRTAGAWGQSAGADLAVNGDFYKTGPLRVYGAAVGSGIPWPKAQTGTDPAYESEWYYQKYGWIAFGPNRVDFSHTAWRTRASARRRRALRARREEGRAGPRGPRAPLGCFRLERPFERVHDPDGRRRRQGRPLRPRRRQGPVLDEQGLAARRGREGPRALGRLRLGRGRVLREPPARRRDG